MDKFKIGIIGCGSIANGKHMPTLAKIDGVEMVAFCDVVDSRAEEAAKKYGIPGAKVFTDYRELLKVREIDNVRVLTDNGKHYEITMEALRAGKHVLCEKPLAISSRDAFEMARTARENGRLLSVGYNHRYNQDSIFLKREIEAGRLGDIYMAKARVLRRRGAPTWGIFTQKEFAGGGPLIDVGTHAIDLALWFMNNYRPKYIVGRTYSAIRDQREIGNLWGDPDPKLFTAEDSAFGMLVMENGAAVIIEASWLLNTLEKGGVRYLLCGDKAGADNFDGSLRINGVTSNTQYEMRPDFIGNSASFINGSNATPAEIEQRTFLNAIAGKGELCVKAEQAAVVVQIIEGLYCSAESGQPYYFSNEEVD